MVIPFVDELSELRIEVVFGFKIDDSQALPVEDAKTIVRLDSSTNNARA